MGKVKDAQLFMLIRNFLEIYLPTYRHAGENTVKSYRTGLNQYLDYVSSKKQISRFAVTGACQLTARFPRQHVTTGWL